jgi:hypothetical protein
MYPTLLNFPLLEIAKDGVTEQNGRELFTPSDTSVLCLDNVSDACMPQIVGFVWDECHTTGPSDRTPCASWKSEFCKIDPWIRREVWERGH